MKQRLSLLIRSAMIYAVCGLNDDAVNSLKNTIRKIKLPCWPLLHRPLLALFFKCSQSTLIDKYIAPDCMFLSCHLRFSE